MKKLLVYVFLLAGVSLAAQKNLSPDISAWNTARPGQKFSRNAGINGGPGLIYERSNEKEYLLKEVICENLQPYKRYRFGVYVKTEGMPKRKEGATVCMAYSTHSGRNGGAWPKGTTEAKDWTAVEDFITLPKDVKKVTMMLYMRRGATGKAYFAEPYIYEDAPVWDCNLIQPATIYSLYPGKQDFLFSARIEGTDFSNGKVAVDFRKNGNIVFSTAAHLRDGKLAIPGVDLKSGLYDVVLTPSDKALKPIVSRIQVLEKEAAPKAGSHVTVDRYGRTILNGKPFLAVGLYSNYKSSPEDFDAWQHAGFNCVMAYDAIFWRRNGAKTPAEGISMTLDDLRKRGIMILFSLKDVKPGRWEKFGDVKGYKNVLETLVKTFRTHPALFGWYLNDEEFDGAFYKAFREQISLLDPFHPTIQVQANMKRYAEAVGYADIFMMDAYPFHKADDGMDNVAERMHRVRDLYGNAIMAAPQTFPWYYYQRDRKHTEFFFPTIQQMRSHILLEAILGAKGFFFYTYTSAMQHKEKTGIDRWPDIASLAKMLNGLSPYLLSIDTPPECVLSKVTGRVFAKAFRADGKTIVLVTGTSGKTSAELTVSGCENLKSRFGGTKNLGGGRYLFTGTNADADILE